MKNNAFIKIKGIQSAGGDRDEVELMTAGFFAPRRGGYVISYEESEATGFEGSRTTLTCEEGKVTLTRTGSVRTQLIIEEGKRHQCSYDLGFGSLIIGVSCARIRSDLGRDGGSLSFGYSLDLNTALTSEHQVTVSVTPN